MAKEDLKIVVLDNCLEFGSKVSKSISDIRNSNKDYTLSLVNSRFSNGEGKVRLESSVRDSDLYIISDVGNYGIGYMLHGREHVISPDEHFQDIKRVISATSGHASRITVVMPLLYQSRQHKRKGRESLDCAIALQELEQLGVNNIITFDVHDPNVSNAIPKLPFENIYPTNVILNDLIDNEQIINENLLVISPDMGAMERTRYYAEMLNCDVGVFYKRRDLSKIVNGKNPIVEHVYMGSDVKDKNIIVVDDMIASGSSMIEVAKSLKEKGARKVYLIATFALLTEGPEAFIEAHAKNIFDKLYTTNLSYVPEEVKEYKWYHEVDCSNQLAQIIDKLNKRESIEELLNDKNSILRKIEKEKKNKTIQLTGDKKQLE